MAEHVPTESVGPDERRALVRLAYRLLGSVEEAEDVVQDAQLKLLNSPRPPDDAYAWLFRAVTNLAIDRLRHLKVQRRAYFGPWLPEPLVTEEEGAEETVSRADDLGVGFLLLLERLSVAERVAFVLREAFDLGFDEMAGVLEVRADACRQRYHRARRKLADARRPPATPGLHRRVLERLIDAVTAGDAERLAALLTDDAVLLTDGGGRVSAAIRPVEDPRRIAQVLVHLAHRPQDGFTFDLHHRDLNGAPALVITATPPEGPPHLYAAMQIDVAGQHTHHIYIIRNPDKLTRL